MNKRVVMMIGATLIAGAGFAAGNVYADKPGPRLIGINCEGAGGDLWAADESDFPSRCEAIERWR